MTELMREVNEKMIVKIALVIGVLGSAVGTAILGAYPGCSFLTYEPEIPQDLLDEQE